MKTIVNDPPLKARDVEALVYLQPASAAPRQEGGKAGWLSRVRTWLRARPRLPAAMTRAED